MYSQSSLFIAFWVSSVLTYTKRIISNINIFTIICTHYQNHWNSTLLCSSITKFILVLIQLAHVRRHFLVKLLNGFKNSCVLWAYLVGFHPHGVVDFLALQLDLANLFSELNFPKLFVIKVGLCFFQLSLRSVKFFLLSLTSSGPLVLDLVQSLYLLLDLTVLISNEITKFININIDSLDISLEQMIIIY